MPPPGQKGPFLIQSTVEDIQLPPDTQWGAAAWPRPVFSAFGNGESTVRTVMVSAVISGFLRFFNVFELYPYFFEFTNPDVPNVEHTQRQGGSCPFSRFKISDDPIIPKKPLTHRASGALLELAPDGQ